MKINPTVNEEIRLKKMLAYNSSNDTQILVEFLSCLTSTNVFNKIPNNTIIFMFYYITTVSKIKIFIYFSSKVLLKHIILYF